MRRIYDISLPVVDGGIRYPGNPPTRVSSVEAIARGDAANVSLVAIGTHTATHVDAVRHFIEGGAAVDEMPLERLIGRALVVTFDDGVTVVGETALRAHALDGHMRVLLKTRNSALLRRPDFVTDYAYLAPDGAEYLLHLGVELVGIDYLSIEQFRSPDHRTHRLLLERGVVIVEGLDLSAVPPGTYDLVCLPLKLAGLDGAPARAVLIGG